MNKYNKRKLGYKRQMTRSSGSFLFPSNFSERIPQLDFCFSVQRTVGSQSLVLRPVTSFLSMQAPGQT
jgi:hypothetical protein